MLDAGARNRLVKIQQRVPARDAAGGETFSFSTRAFVWARVRWLSLSDAVAGGQPVETRMGEVLIRYRADVADTDRVVINGVPYDVVSSAPTDMNDELRISVKTPGTQPT